MLPKESASWARGERLVRVILTRGWTLGALAEAAGVGRTTLYRLTAGRGCTLATWEKVAAALDLSLSELLDLVG